MVLYKEQERICRELGNIRELAGCLTNQVYALDMCGRWSEAKSKGEEALRLAESSGLRYEVVAAKSVLFKTRLHITPLKSSFILAILAMTGVALGLLNPWLWLVGIPIMGIASIGIVFSTMPHVGARIFTRLRQAIANANKEKA